VTAVAPAAPLFVPRLGRRRASGRIFAALCVLTSLLSVAVLAVLLGRVLLDGLPYVSWAFLSRTASQLRPELSGIAPALWGTVWVMGLTALFAIPLGVGAAVYLNEYARTSRLSRLIELNIANLAGVPSIVYGLLGLTLFVRLGSQIVEWLHAPTNPFNRSVLSGALTMTLLVLPVVIIAAREALAAVPDSTRHAAYALGATRWQTVWSHVLPAALPGILTGLILSLSRAIGEAAPLIVLGGVAYISSGPTGLDSPFTALPIQIYDWSAQPNPIFRERLAAAASIVLLAVLFLMNATSVALRAWQQGKRSG
jgi:phosphate transport system permease protein